MRGDERGLGDKWGSGIKVHDREPERREVSKGNTEGQTLRESVECRLVFTNNLWCVP